MTTILALSFHPAFYPPKSGGEERLYYVYHYLSSSYNLILITFTHQNDEKSVEIIEHDPTFKEIRIPKTSYSSFIYHLLFKFGSIKESSAVATSVESIFNAQFKKIVQIEMESADILMFVSPFLSTIPIKKMRKKVIYESYNNEFLLMKPFFSKSVIGIFFLNFIYYLERRLCKKSDLIFTVSLNDRDSLSSIYKVNNNKIVIAPNGVPVHHYDNVFINRGGKKKKPVSIFIGSYHPPNIEAIEQIISIASKTPDIIYLVLGNASHYFFNKRKEVEPCIAPDFDHFFPKKGVLIEKGLYPEEQWGETIVAWTKPVFTLHIEPGIEKLSFTVFSTQEQVLNMKEEEEDSYSFNLFSGWNTISFDCPNHKTSHIKLLSCEKIIVDSIRELGIAIKDVCYFKNDCWGHLGIQDISWKIYRFIQTKNVYLLGLVSENEKLSIYQEASVAINPMMSGSGTNLKVLGYLASGIPLITTPIGARGLGLEHNKNAIICETADFPKNIYDLLQDDGKATSLAENGRKLVETTYDWSIITKTMVDEISKLLPEG